MNYKIAIRYQGDSGFGGEIEANEYTRSVKLELLGLVANLMDFEGFAWQIIDGDGEVVDSYNC
jgi:hypothetical protein